MRFIVALTLIVSVAYADTDYYKVDVQRYDNPYLNSSRYDISIKNQNPRPSRLAIVDYLLSELVPRTMTGGEAAMRALNRYPYERLLNAQTELIQTQTELLRRQAGQDTTWQRRQWLLEQYDRMLTQPKPRTPRNRVEPKRKLKVQTPYSSDYIDRATSFESGAKILRVYLMKKVLTERLSEQEAIKKYVSEGGTEQQFRTALRGVRAKIARAKKALAREQVSNPQKRKSKYDDISLDFDF